MSNISKTELIRIINKLDLKGTSSLKKDELVTFIVNNPCTKLTKDDCVNISRDELRKIARICNVKMTKDACHNVVTKYKNVDKTDIIKLRSYVKRTPPVKKSPKIFRSNTSYLVKLPSELYQNILVNLDDDSLYKLHKSTFKQFSYNLDLRNEIERELLQRVRKNKHSTFRLNNLTKNKAIKEELQDILRKQAAQQRY